MDRKTFYLVAAVLIFAAFFASSYIQSQQARDVLGGDRDEHGCIGSAGYSWCEEKQACIRTWEEPCAVACTMDAKICPDGTAVGRNGSNNCEFDQCPGEGTISHLVGDDRDEHGCIGSAGYSWCEEKQACIRTWEEPCGDNTGMAEPNVGMANPAAEYCRKMGYDYRIVEDESGQRGECLTKEGIWIDEWALYRDEIDIVQPYTPPVDPMAEKCKAAGGNWNECGNRCQTDNQGKEGVACNLMCESLCECAGPEGYKCPDGYTCVIKSGAADALGYCSQE